MLTLDRKQEALALRDRRESTPALLGGVLYVGLGLVPLSADTPFTGLRALGLVAILGVAAWLVWLGLPRTRFRPLPARATGSSRAPRPLRLELTSEPLPLSYRAELVHDDGSRLLLLERGEPAGVLTDAVVLARELDVPLAPGWGLDEQTLEALLHPPRDAEARAQQAEAVTLDAPGFAGQRNAAFSTLWAAGFVLVATVVMSESARALVTPSVLAVALPSIGAVLVLVVGVWLVGYRARVTIGPTGVSQQRLCFGWALGRAESVEVAVECAVVVGPQGATAGHVVLATPNGFLAFLVRGGMPRALLRATSPVARATRAAE